MKEQEAPDWYPRPWVVPSSTGSQDNESEKTVQRPATEPVKPVRHLLETRTPSTNSPEKPKTTKLTGRLATSPRFDIRPDRARVNFVLAQHDEAGQTTFHQMYSTREYAVRLSGKNLRKGDLIEVAGVWQKSVTRGRNGQVLEKPVFYCYGARIR